MKLAILIIGFMMCSYLSKAQSSTSDNSKQTLTAKYSAKVLAVYQENSKTKIEDVFTYFQMLTDVSLTVELKNEVVNNINQLFKNKNVIVVDFTSEAFDKIPLQEFIAKLLTSKSIILKVSDESLYDSVTFDSWKTEYVITRIKSGVTSKTKVTQKILMLDIQKEFGNKTKIVTEVLLDEMQ